MSGNRPRTTMADLLKNTQIRRSRDLLDTNRSVENPPKEEVSDHSDNEEHDIDSKELDHSKDDKDDIKEEKHERKETKKPLDLIQRLRKLQDKKDDNHETHRASSRGRQVRKYDSDEEDIPKRRSYKQDDSDEEDHKYSRKKNEKNYQDDNHRGNKSNNRYNKYHDDSDEEELDRRDKRSYKDDSDDEVDYRRKNNKSSSRPLSRKSRDDDEKREVKTSRKNDRTKEHESDNRRRVSNRSETVAFNLPKTAIAKISKSVGVPSMSNDVYDIVKELSGTFVHDVIKAAAKETDSINSEDVRKVVEQLTGKEVEDLKNSNINMTTFARYCKDVASQYNASVKSGAGYYLNNALEVYLRDIFRNAADLAGNSRRSRVTPKDIELGSRM
jgi:histone H3/H4